jgi:tetratricopeptide (TPR) repeat protein
MKNVHLIIVISLYFALNFHIPAFAGNYTELDLIGFSRDGDYLAYQVGHQNKETALFQKRIYILDVNNQKIIKTLTQDLKSAPTTPATPASQAISPAPQAQPVPLVAAQAAKEIQPQAHEDFNTLCTASLEKQQIITWNKGLAVYQTRLDRNTVYPQLSKEVSFVIRDENNLAHAYKVSLQQQDAREQECEHGFLTYRPSIFTCKVAESSWEGVLALPVTEMSADQSKGLPEMQNCFRDYFIQSIYIYRNKIVVFIFAGAPTSGTADASGMSWEILTVLGNLNRIYAVIPEAPALVSVTPPSQYAAHSLLQADWSQQAAMAVEDTGAAKASSTPATGSAATGAAAAPDQLAGKETTTVNVLPANTMPFFPLPSPHLEIISPDPDYGDDVYLNWDEIPGATAYKVYRALLPITDTKALKPLAITTDWFYLDKDPKEKRIYWYAVTAVDTPILSARRSAATKGETVDAAGANPARRHDRESAPSRSRSVLINAGPAGLSFWEDFDANNAHTIPAGWTTNGNTTKAMWFFAHSSWAIPSLQLLVSDNLGNASVWGCTDIKSSVQEGWFECDFKLEKQMEDTGSGEQDYCLHLKTEKGKEKVLTLRINYSPARHQYAFNLQGKTSREWFNENEAYHLQLAFGSQKASLQVDGVTVISDAPYMAKPIRQLTIETSAGTKGGGCLLDNIALWDNRQMRDSKTGPASIDVHSSAPRTQNRQELFSAYRLTDDNMRAEAFNQIGFQLYKQNKYQEALQMFLCAIEQDYTYARGYYNLACMLCLLAEQSPDTGPGREQALSYLENAYRFNPEFVQRAQRDQDLESLKKIKAFQILNERYYYSFNSTDLAIFAEGFARSVRAHRWPELLNYFERSYLAEYYERFYDKKTDLFFCDFFELSNLLTFKAKKELSTYLINQIKDCEVIKLTDKAVTFRLRLTTEANTEREIIINLKQRTEGGKTKYGFTRYFPPRG